MIAFEDDLLDGQFIRTLGHATYGGAEPGECFAAAAEIHEHDRESWLAAWSALAARTQSAADASLSAGHRVSARGAYLRASNYWRNAYILHLERPLPDSVLAAYRAHRDTFRSAAALLDERVEVIGIPHDGATLPGYFCAAPVGGPRPLVISVGGYDSTAEESFFYNAVAAMERGYHCVLFDGPGQGSMLLEQRRALQPDWYRVISSVIQWAVERTDVSPEQIIVIGLGAAARHADPRRRQRMELLRRVP